MSQLVVFGLGREEYALPIEQVQEIIRAVAPRTLPHADPGLLGVINLRGVTIPVFDLALVLGGSPQEGEGKIIVIEGESQRVGIVVDEVSEVLTVSDEQFEQAARRRPAPLGDREGRRAADRARRSDRAAPLALARSRRVAPRRAARSS